MDISSFCKIERDNARYYVKAIGNIQFSILVEDRNDCEKLTIEFSDLTSKKILSTDFEELLEIKGCDYIYNDRIHMSYVVTEKQFQEFFGIIKRLFKDCF